MRVKHTFNNDTEAVVVVVADTAELTTIKQQIISEQASNVKIAGFREGKAPLELVEKQLDPARLQTQFLEEAVNQLYPQAIRSEKLRPVGQPDISIQKFVPFTTLEFEAKVPVIGKISVPNYSKLKIEKPKVSVVQKDVDEVIASLQKRMSEKTDVQRAAKNTDQVWIDFVGKDQNGDPIKNADGKNYPLVLGSNTFIPGFEPELVGLKAGEEKSFTLTFPKDYGVKAMAGKKVTFTVTVHKVQSVTEPKVDDVFAAKSGPFKTVAELKSDIKRQLQVERQQQADREYESELVRAITKKTKVNIPEVLINDQVERMVQETKQNLMYRGQTWDEYLESQNSTESDYIDKVLKPQAEERVKASLILSEIAEVESLTVSNEELEARIIQLKAQYKDQAMQGELDKPENRSDIASRILTEKVITKIVDAQ